MNNLKLSFKAINASGKDFITRDMLTLKAASMEVKNRNYPGYEPGEWKAVKTPDESLVKVLYKPTFAVGSDVTDKVNQALQSSGSKGCTISDQGDIRLSNVSFLA